MPAQPMNRAYRIALICGALPLVVGITVFVLWVCTDSEFFVTAGAFTVMGGLVCFVTGVLALAYYSWGAFRQPDYPKKKAWISTLACLGLLFSNFPAAFGLIVAAITIENRSYVVVHNETEAPLENVIIWSSGFAEALGTIPPQGKSEELKLNFARSRELRIHAVSGGTSRNKIIDDSFSPDWRDQIKVTFRPDGTIAVNNSR